MKRVKILVDTPCLFQSRLQYTLDFINEHPLFKKKLCLLYLVDGSASDIDIRYVSSVDKSSSLLIARAGCLFEENKAYNEFILRSSSFFHSPYQYIIHKDFKPHKSAHNTYLYFDIFESIFFLISRYEEVYCPESELGPSGFLKESEHLLVKNMSQSTPIVDRLVGLLLQFIGISPDASPNIYILSHDVDLIYRFNNPLYFIRSILSSLYHRRGGAQMTRDAKHYLSMISQKGYDPYSTFDILLDMSNKWDEKWIFLMSGGHTKYDNKYSIKDPELAQIVDMATKRGYTYGLHASYNAHSDSQMLAEEKETLEKHSDTRISINRQHCLRFDWKITPYTYEKLHIEKDSSMGYNNYIGYRCGTGFPYRMYNFKEERRFCWIEYPISLMDSSAIKFSKKYEISLEVCIQDHLALNSQNSFHTLNFHNSNFDITTPHGQELTRVYKQHILSL